MSALQAGAAIVSLKRLTMFLTLEDRQDEVIHHALSNSWVLPAIPSHCESKPKIQLCPYEVAMEMP